MIVAVTAWGWGWLLIAGSGAILETVALVKNKNGTLSRNLRRVTGGGRKWAAVTGWIVFAVWFPLHLWVFTPSSTVPSQTGVALHRPRTTVAPHAGCVEGVRPDPRCTPGTTNPAVTQATIHSTICVRGWTATVRPPVSVTDKIKTERMKAYGVGSQSKTLFELDHMIPLEVGGGTADVLNLWPEAYAGKQGARTKDHVENLLKARVCAGTVTLAEAQHEIVTDWTVVR